ncbi:hypothetical protein [Lentzea sp. NPDC051838]|uniref:hypothetical protein n=1 Tax=Lentzea sp. NPDC051838 TaxID=3154849 RepID=UPI0034182041
MRIAVQIGLPVVAGVLCLISSGWLLALAFGLKWAPGVVLYVALLTGLFIAIGCWVVDGDWTWRVFWGLVVSLVGFAAATLVYVATKHTQWGILFCSLPFGVVAALLSRNVWGTAIGVAGVVAGWVLIPEQMLYRCVRMWSEMHF